MRLWSIHPKHLDVQGLSGLWRETLLAKNVLLGLTKGYKNHPQLNRFYSHKNQIDAINYYLSVIWDEACSRGYSFDSSKFYRVEHVDKINVTWGQVRFEYHHLLSKIKKRSPKLVTTMLSSPIEVHPLFNIISGSQTESWEKI